MGTDEDTRQRTGARKGLETRLEPRYVFFSCFFLLYIYWWSTYRYTTRTGPATRTRDSGRVKTRLEAPSFHPSFHQRRGTRDTLKRVSKFSLFLPTRTRGSRRVNTRLMHVFFYFFIYLFWIYLWLFITDNEYRAQQGLETRLTRLEPPSFYTWHPTRRQGTPGASKRVPSLPPSLWIDKEKKGLELRPRLEPLVCFFFPL